MTRLSVKALSVSYSSSDRGRVDACRDIDLDVGVGEFVSIIGPSGCGKSTLLHAMGGMLAPTSGSVHLDGERMSGPSAKRVAFVFQDYSLFPWKSALENVAIGPIFSGENRRRSLAKAQEKLEMVGLGDVGRQYPGQLSGGMQQRVAVARALAMEPSFLLMDEPFGALDEQTRRSLGCDISERLTNTGQGVVLITHSLEEAVFWGDRVAVMQGRPGTIVRQISVKKSRPRDIEFMTSQEYDSVRAELFKLIRPKAAQGAERSS